MKFSLAENQPWMGNLSLEDWMRSQLSDLVVAAIYAADRLRKSDPLLGKDYIDNYRSFFEAKARLNGFQQCLWWMLDYKSFEYLIQGFENPDLMSLKGQEIWIDSWWTKYKKKQKELYGDSWITRIKG